jgi:hypothetical protein
MRMISAAGSPELGNTPAYQDRLLSLLGTRDPLEVLSQTPGRIAEMIRAYPHRVLRMRPFEGRWTPLEILGHLADAEIVYGYRIRLVLCEPRPTILSMDQELWVSGQKHNQGEPAELLEMFTALRRANLALWRRMTPAELQREGVHSERGPESLGLMLRMNAGHDLSHIDQISRYLAAAQRKQGPAAGEA